jgi:hypothetical protein
VFPQWLDLTFPAAVTFQRVEFYTDAEYPARGFTLQTWNGTDWVDLEIVTNNLAVHRTFVFGSAVTTTALRVVAQQGPTQQPNFVRVNEIELYCE